MNYYLGIDLGGTNIKAGIVNDDFDIIGKSILMTNCPRKAELIADDMVRAAQFAAADAGISLNNIEYIGIGSPGIANKDLGIIEFSSNLGFKNTPITELIKNKIDKPIYLENDANAAVYGEFCAGIGKGKKNIIGITLGTGIGGGIIINSEIYSGFNFAGGEIGHMVIETDGVECSCGRKGCFEAYASAKALINSAKDFMSRYKESKMWELADGNLDSLTIHNIFEAAALKDTAASKVLANYFKYLSTGIINIVNIFQPEILFFGGVMANEKDNLTKPVLAALEKEAYNRNSQNKTEIAVASIGNDAGIIGAAMLGKK